MNREAFAKRGVLILSLLLLAAFITLNLLLPLLALFGRALDFTPFWAGFTQLLSGRTTRAAIRNSLCVTTLAATLAVVCAYFYAYIVELKLKGSLRRAFRAVAVLPMLVPSITHGVVIVYLFGRMGLFTRLFGLRIDIYGAPGILLGSFFYAFPTAFLLFSQTFISLDGRLFENTRVLGVRPLRRFFDITLPMTRYSIFSALAVCFTMIFTDYGVPLSVGGTYPILPVLFYKNVIGRLDFSAGALYGVLLLAPAALVYLLEVLYFSKKQASTRSTTLLNTGRFHPLQMLPFALLTLAVVVCIAVIAAVPFVSGWPYDLRPTLQHFALIAQGGKLWRLLQNSLLIALGTGILGTVLSFAAGYIYVRAKGGARPLKRTVHGLYTLTLAIPGLALGLAYALFFRGTALYNTQAILILVNVLHFFGSPYMMTISHLKLLDPNLEDVCRSLGAGALRTFTDVLLPASKKLLTDVFAYFFTNTMITISAVSLLYTARTTTLAVQITALSDQGASESAVAISLVILLVNITVKLWQTAFLKKSLAKDFRRAATARGS